MRKRIFWALIVLSILLLIGFAFIGNGIAKLTTDFEVLPSDSRILYERGAESLAEEAARHLSSAISIVESKQCGKFKEAVKVYAFANTKSFSEFSGASEVVTGAGLNNEVYLSGKLLETMEKARGTLTHELSHVQLSQTLGVIKFNRTLPRWFREGLAVYVADGGGATIVSEAESIENFLQGKHFSPVTEGALLNLKLPATKGLEPKIFYHQSGMFVQYLASDFPLHFQTLVKGLQEGKEFKTQFSESFKAKADEMLKAYIEKLKKT